MFVRIFFDFYDFVDGVLDLVVRKEMIIFIEWILVRLWGWDFLVLKLFFKCSMIVLKVFKIKDFCNCLWLVFFFFLGLRIIKLLYIVVYSFFY